MDVNSIVNCLSSSTRSVVLHGQIQLHIHPNRMGLQKG